jgi:hypothetical protein
VRGLNEGRGCRSGGSNCNMVASGHRKNSVTLKRRSTHERSCIACAKRKSTGTVTADNFTRAETDRTFDSIGKQGGFGKFVNYRELTPLDRQVVPRSTTATHFMRSRCSIWMRGR